MRDEFGIFSFRPRRDYWRRKRLREVPILVLGRLGWTVREIAKALGVTPPTVYSSVAACLLDEEGKLGRSNVPTWLKLRATMCELAALDSQLALSDKDLRVRDALRLVLEQVVPVNTSYKEDACLTTKVFVLSR